MQIIRNTNLLIKLQVKKMKYFKLSELLGCLSELLGCLSELVVLLDLNLEYPGFVIVGWTQ
jgi:hypothetical protein